MAFEKRPNCKFTCAQVIRMMFLFPFFSIRNAASYYGSSLQSLFDCRKDIFYSFGKKGECKALPSTDTSLTPYKAYRTYSMRWSIEVVFHETKSLLNLGKCQCRDFGSQIASISINMLQYNLLSYVKRFESYETIGGLFREITAQTVELSITEKIWGLIQEIVSTIAEFFSTDFDELMANIICENKQLKAMMGLVQRLQIAA